MYLEKLQKKNDYWNELLMRNETGWGNEGKKSIIRQRHSMNNYTEARKQSPDQGTSLFSWYTDYEYGNRER